MISIVNLQQITREATKKNIYKNFNNKNTSVR